LKIRCAYCRELFEPSPSQLKGLSPYGDHFCSRECRFPKRPERPEQPPVVPEDLYTGGQEVHLRVGRRRDLRRLIRVIADVDCELVRIRPTMKPAPPPVPPPEETEQIYLLDYAIAFTHNGQRTHSLVPLSWMCQHG
jgi:hypothetical protein